MGEGLDGQAMFARLSDRIFGETAAPPRVGRFRVTGSIGQGGMGQVFAGLDEDLERRVALKLLHAGFDEEQRGRLRREAQVLARLNHPNVVHVYEVGEHEGVPFVAMEHVEGRTLAAWRHERRRSWQEIVEVYRQAARGLAAAHAAGIVHRDFKPSNVMVGHDERVRVLDFGLARETSTVTARSSDPEATSATTGPSSSMMLHTRTGAIMGTPAYMSPEQQGGRASGPASDQFSFCLALYEALFDESPLAGQTGAARMEAILAGHVERVDAASRCPGWLRRLVLRGLRPLPQERHPSMAALVEALDRGHRRRRVTALTVGMASLAIASLALAVWGSSANVAESCPYEGDLAGVWDEPRKLEIERAFMSTGRPEAVRAHQVVTEALDGFAERWRGARAQACEADARRSAVDDDPRARLRCLDLRRRELLHLGSLLAEADERVVTRAPLLVGALPPIEACMQITGRPAPDEASALATVELRASLTEARFLRAAGRFQDAGDVLDQALLGARDHRDRGIEAEVRLEQGLTLDRQGRHREAIEHLELSVALALAEDDRPLIVSASLKLAEVELFPFGNVDAARRILLQIDELVEELPPSARRLADWHRARGMLETQQQHVDRAIEEHRREVELLRAEVPVDPSQLAEAITLLANALADAGRPTEALALYREVVELRERAYGHDHPLLARAFMNIGIVYGELGRPAEARAHYEQALALLRVVEDTGEYWADAATTRQGLAIALYELDPEDPGPAIELAEQAQAILQERLEPVDPRRIEVGRTLCNLYEAGGRELDVLRCLQNQEHLHDTHELEDPIWDIRVNIAQSLVAQERHVEARSYMEEAMPRIREELGARDARLVLPLMRLVVLEEAEGGDPARALVALEQVRAAVAHEAEVDPEYRDYVSQAIALGAWRLAVHEHAAGGHAREAVLLDEATQRYARLDASFEGDAQLEEIRQWRAEHPHG